MAARDPDSAVDESAETRVEPDARARVDAGPPPQEETPEAPPPKRERPRRDDPLRIGRYTVLRRLGHGGMGVVYAAYDGELDRRIAIKVIAARHRGGSLGRARMQREAQALAKLSHPNVVQIFEVGELDSRVYLAMEYVQGPTLKRWVRERIRSWREILAVYLEAARGLQAAHSVGLVHRDFKPANAIVGDDGRVRVLDFGLARVELAGEIQPEPAASASGSRSAASRTGRRRIETLPPSSSQSIHPSSVLVSEITEAGTLLGTPAYMSPEQLDRRPADARSDLFSFCVALWEALAGVRPFSSTNDRELREQISVGPRGAPRAVPAAIVRVLRRGLAEDPFARPQSMNELIDELDRAAHRGRRLLLATGLTAAIAAASGLSFYLSQRSANSLAARCEAAADLSGVYDEAIVDEIQAAIAGAGVSYGADTWSSIAPRLQTHAEALTQARRQTCLAADDRARAVDGDLLNAQRICLDRRRSELLALTSLLRRADAGVVEQATATLDALGPIEGCLDVDALRGALDREVVHVAPEDAAAVAAIESRLAEANVERLADHVDRGKELAEEALRASEGLELPGHAGLALFRMGQLHEIAGETADARAALVRAFARAERAGDDRLAVDVATELVRVDGTELRELAPARVWWSVAESKLGRAGDDPGQRLMILLQAGVALIECGRRAEAVPLFRDALPLAEARRAQNPRTYVSALNIYAAGVLQGSGALTEAEGMMEKAIQLQVGITGAEHPYVGMLYYNLGGVQLLRGQLGRARENFELALKIREGAYGPDHPEVAQSLNGLAAVLADLDRVDEAIPLLERSIAIDERFRGADHPELIYALNLLAEAHILAERWDDAEATLRRARKILDDRGLGESSPSVLIDTGLANLELTRQRPARAREYYLRALERAERQYDRDHAVPAELRLDLADVELDLGRVSTASELLARAEPVLSVTDHDSGDIRAHMSLIRLRIAAADPAARPAALREGRELLDRLIAEPNPSRGLIGRFRRWLEGAR
ncbi:MAG: serine/threonine-protein kinase [Nannocystaceae bacterium]